MSGTTRTAAVLLAAALPSCSSPTGPTADLSGTWSYSFSTVAAADACPQAPPGFRAGCSGGGQLSLNQQDTQLQGNVNFRGACQSCGAVADFFGSDLSMNGRWMGGDIELNLATGQCRHTAAVPPGMPNRVSGTVTCNFGVMSRGTWTMTRS